MCITSQADIKFCYIPSPELFALVRAALIEKGSSFNKFCLSHGLDQSNTSKYVKGITKYPGAVKTVSFVVDTVLGDRYAMD